MKSLFIALFVLFFASVFAMLFTKSGRNILVSMAYGRILRELDNTGDEKAVETSKRNASQEFRLMEVERKGEMFYVLETRQASTLQHTKISKTSARKLLQMLDREQQSGRLRNDLSTSV